MDLCRRFVLCLLGAALAAPAPGVAQNDWHTYRNERYAFRLSYPADSRVEEHRLRGYHQISIDNADDTLELQSGKLRVDVLIYDLRLGHRPKGTCHELLRDTHSVKVGKVRALRGIYQPEGAEHIAQAICLESAKLQILVKALEGDQSTELAGRVLDSMRFGN
jgi:hypothetical protein